MNVSFDGQVPTEWIKSAQRYYQFTHYVNVTRHGAVRVAGRPEELVEYVGRYLDDPSLDREGRRRVVLEQCPFLDGRSAERVANYVVQELADVTRSNVISARSAPTKDEPDPCAVLLDSSR